MSDQLLLFGGALLLFVLIAAPYVARTHRIERESHAAREQAVASGTHEPMSLHPVIDLDRCIGSAGCVDACPEEVIGMRNGRAFALAPALCVGHGLCERACPMEAIRLVFGSATRGVDLPRVREDFQTNVPGLYIVGELSGMGLIRNAFEQARQCVTGMRNGADDGHDMLDLAIVGCGPAGLAASLYAQQRGMRFTTFEKEEDVGGAVRAYPRKKIVMAGTLNVPGYRKLQLGEILKEELVDVWRDVIRHAGLEIATGAVVSAVRPLADGGFEIVRAGAEEPVRARRVVLALGRRGIPRRLGVPGEDAPHVAHSLIDAEPFAGDRVLIVGGGDSAVEAALALCAQPDTKVWLAYRGAALARVKPRNRERFDAEVGAGRIEPVFGAVPVSLEPGAARLRLAHDATRDVPADRVFVLIGGEMPTTFLRSCGVDIETRFGS